MIDKKIVCLGGGIGTVNLIKGLKKYTDAISVIVSMADDGGSAGRLRRFYSIPPPGDLVSCIAAMSEADPILKQMLTYRFAGNRYGSDRSLPGHKLGNLMLVALNAITGDFTIALSEMQRLFQTKGKIIPSTMEGVSIWAKTTVGETVYREENIDLGRFTGSIETLYLKPANPETSPEAISAIMDADVVITGPGDLYTTIIPVLLVPDIQKAIRATKAKKFFVVNVANKLFETPNYTIDDYVNAIVRHCNERLFDSFFVNNNFDVKIPRKFVRQYEYMKVDDELLHAKRDYKLFAYDLVDPDFPLYHNPGKLAKAIVAHI